MSFFPLEKKTTTKEFKNVIPHFIISHNQTLKLYCCIKPIPKSQLKKKHISLLT